MTLMKASIKSRNMLACTYSVQKSDEMSYEKAFSGNDTPDATIAAEFNICWTCLIRTTIVLNTTPYDDPNRMIIQMGFCMQ